MLSLTRRKAAGLLAAGAITAALPADAAAPEKFATLPIDRLSLPWWRHRFEEKQARLRQGRVDFLFLGDSIIQQFEFNDRANPRGDYAPVWDRFYGHRNAVNLGFIGDTTANLLWRLRNGELDNISPRAVALLIGANNMGNVHWGVDATLAGIAVNIAELQRRVPKTPIILISVLPSDRGPWVTETVTGINKALAERYGKPGVPNSNVTYIDVTRLFTLPSGAIDPGKYIDPRLRPPEPSLHPSPEGMAALAAAIEPTLKQFV